MIKFNQLSMINTYDLEQGSDEWLRARSGVITASNAHLVIMDDKLAAFPKGLAIELISKGVNKVNFKNKNIIGTKQECINEVRKMLPVIMPDSKSGYLNKLIGEVCTGEISGGSLFKQAEWGHENETPARDSYEAMNFANISQCGLIYKDESLRCAISPDGLDNDAKRGLEIKSPYTTQVHIATLRSGTIKPEYIAQCQFSMWVTGWDEWAFCSYDNRMKGEAKNRLHTIIIKKGNEYMDKFEEEVPKFIKNMDEALDALGFKFGDQWKEDI